MTVGVARPQPRQGLLEGVVIRRASLTLSTSPSSGWELPVATTDGEKVLRGRYGQHIADALESTHAQQHEIPYYIPQKPRVARYGLGRR